MEFIGSAQVASSIRLTIYSSKRSRPQGPVPVKGSPVVSDFEKLLAAVWEVPRTPLTLYLALGSRTAKHSVISIFDDERVDFLVFSSKSAMKTEIR